MSSNMQASGGGAISRKLQIEDQQKNTRMIMQLTST